MHNKLKTALTFILLISSISYILIKCISENIDQEKTYQELKFNFITSAVKSKSNKFDYQYDALTPQESFLINCKLKYLILKNSGELSDSEQLIEFNNDSISKIIMRKTLYKGKNNGKEAGRDWYNIESDSVFVLDYKNNKKEIYKKNKLVKKIDFKESQINNQFIYNVKLETEKNYKCK